MRPGAWWGTALASELTLEQLQAGMQWPARLADVDDGLSNTVLLAEQAGLPEAAGIFRMPNIYLGGPLAPGNSAERFCNCTGMWIEADLQFTVAATQPFGGPLVQAVNDSNCGAIYGFHAGGVNTAHCDGSVHFLADSTDVRVLAVLLVRRRPLRLASRYRTRRTDLRIPHALMLRLEERRQQGVDAQQARARERRRGRRRSIE